MKMKVEVIYTVLHGMCQAQIVRFLCIGKLI